MCGWDRMNAMKFKIIFAGPIQEPEKHLDQVSGRFPEQTSKYDVEGIAMVRCERSRTGATKVIPLANFSARIVRDFVLDDCPARRQFEIHAKLPGQERIVIVAASAFHRMNWILDHLGPQAIVYPGQQQHAHAAIQAFSGVIARQCAFSHLGWQKVNEDWLYLDASGGVSAQGRRSDPEVRLPGPLSRYRELVPDSQEVPE